MLWVRGHSPVGSFLLFRRRRTANETGDLDARDIRTRANERYSPTTKGKINSGLVSDGLSSRSGSSGCQSVQSEK